MSFDFYNLTKEMFSFLEVNGFKTKTSTPVRGESSISYTSKNLMILLCYLSYSDECWCVVGGSREHYPAKPLSLAEVFEFHGLDILLPKKPSQYLSQLSAILKSELASLSRDETYLLEPIWEEKDNLENTLFAHQNETAFSIVETGKAQILELPNTPDALGKEYLEQFPHHDFSSDKVWLVRTDIASSVCDSFEQAQVFAKSFGD